VSRRSTVVAPDDGFEFIKRLRVPALALRGEKDSVPDPPGIELTVVPG
jgi:hypothetical protein